MEDQPDAPGESASRLAAGALSIDVDAAIAHWREHGWARLGLVASDDALLALRTRADAIMLGQVNADAYFYQKDGESGRYEDLVFGRGYEGPSLEYRKIEKLEIDPVFRPWLENALFERVVRAAIGPEVTVYRATLFSKGARGGTELPWHQDGGNFWGLSRDPELQIWTALDDAPEESGCVEVVSGTHTAGLTRPVGGMIPKNIHEPARASERKISLPARAGEVLLIHNYVWHRSGRNISGKARRAFSVAYMPASTYCLRQKRAPRSFVKVFERAAR